MSTSSPVTTPSATSAGEPHNDDCHVLRHRRWPLALTVTALALLAVVPAVVTTVRARAEPYERLLQGFPGLDVGVATAIGQAIADAASTVTVGALLWLLFFRTARGHDAARLGGLIELTVLQIASAIWATAAMAMVVFEMFDSSGVPFARLGEPGAVQVLYEASAFPQAWTVAAAAAMVVFVMSMFADRWTGLLIPLWASIFGVLAPVVVGQILVGPNHDFGSDAGIYQALVAPAVFGLMVVATIRVLSGRPIAPEILARLCVTIAVLLPVLIAADALLAWFKLAGSGLFDSVTGWQILLRATGWLIAGTTICAAWASWRRGRLTAHRMTGLLLISTAAAGVWLGVSAAMTRIPPPQYFAPTSITQIYLGFEAPDEPTLEVLFTQWRPNLLFLVVAIAAVTVYLWAVRALRRRGDRWPIGRTVSWIAGWGVVVFATSSGFGRYSAPDFGIHMIVHMSLNMLAPILLVMGGVLTLLLRVTRSDDSRPAGLHEWITWVLHWPVLRFVFNPLLVFALFVGSYYGLYLTGLFGEYMRFHWAHQLMNAHFLVAGYLFYSLVIGVDRPPRPLPHIGKLGFVLAAMPFHAFFGVILMSSTEIIAENFYRSLALPWADLQSAQYLAGGVAWAGGELPLLIVIIALGVQWSRQDAKDAHHTNRHFDTGRADEFDQYNRMLEQLAHRPGRQPAPGRRDVDQENTT
ncbi:cytochrome c oxidase assembly protein [Ruania alba]|uniref:Putative copper resistance protein D n=1 Tax=Ruania alba TaxID=648782 RepID=A0A1H5GGV3_9MICO|nr:cytochrome c oxidase assembly protein [Ruania alba]SEE14694.1 putative copper resistance protein D [Ruania alba]